MPKIGLKEAQLKTLRMRRQEGDPKPTLDDLRQMVEQASEPKPRKQKARMAPVLADDAEAALCPTCGGTGIAPATPPKASPVVDAAEAKRIRRREYMRDYMREHPPCSVCGKRRVSCLAENCPNRADALKRAREGGE
jgi:hypothetical protein